MQGFNVFHPMGFDSFGLPAENYAIKTGIHPKDSTLKNIATMEKQLREMGATYDWDYELATCMPEYYKWNQWFFIQLALFSTIDALKEFGPEYINITTHRSEYVYVEQPDGTYLSDWRPSPATPDTAQSPCSHRALPQQSPCRTPRHACSPSASAGAS